MPPDLEPQVLNQLRNITGADHVLEDSGSLLEFGRDYTRFLEPRPAAVVLPGAVAEVQALVRVCMAHQIAVVPSGGRTGLSGGAVAGAGELVVAMDRMNAVLSLSQVDRSVRCEAGVVTAVLQDYVAERGLHYPVDFASSGSSQIGGNVATNAGGIKVIRYGMTRDWVAGLTVVTGTGDVLELNRGLTKNNAGYDLRHLFVGSEGTLGIIVDATLRLTAPPGATTVLLMGVDELSCLMEVVDAFRGQVDISAFEFFSETALRHVLANGAGKRPFTAPAGFYVLLEFIDEGSALEAAMACFQHCVDRGWVGDGVVSQSGAQAAALWHLRENISESIAPRRPYKNDLSVLPSRVPELLAEVEGVTRARYPDLEILWYGHIGDGNLHLNILKPAGLSVPEFTQRCAHASEEIYAVVARFGGSISAEHGVGLLKRDYLHYTHSPVEIELMKQIKRAFDPLGIMNPGKVLAGPQA